LWATLASYGRYFPNCVRSAAPTTRPRTQVGSAAERLNAASSCDGPDQLMIGANVQYLEIGTNVALSQTPAPTERWETPPISPKLRNASSP